MLAASCPRKKNVSKYPSTASSRSAPPGSNKEFVWGSNDSPISLFRAAEEDATSRVWGAFSQRGKELLKLDLYTFLFRLASDNPLDCHAVIIDDVSRTVHTFHSCLQAILTKALKLGPLTSEARAWRQNQHLIGRDQFQLGDSGVLCNREMGRNAVFYISGCRFQNRLCDEQGVTSHKGPQCVGWPIVSHRPFTTNVHCRRCSSSNQAVSNPALIWNIWLHCHCASITLAALISVY